MQSFNTLRAKLRYRLGYVSWLSGYIFMDDDAIFRKLRDDGVVQYIKQLRPSERRLLHFSLGRDIRNAFMLWHPNNPYTTLKLKGLSVERWASSPYHPDNFSWSIISRLIVAANIIRNTSDIDTSEHLLYSLMARADDGEDTLQGIRESVEDLVANAQWELLDEVFAETIEYDPSTAKLNALLNAIDGYSGKLTPINYLRVAQRAVNNGIELPK